MFRSLLLLAGCALFLGLLTAIDPRADAIPRAVAQSSDPSPVRVNDKSLIDTFEDSLADPEQRRAFQEINGESITPNVAPDLLFQALQNRRGKSSRPQLGLYLMDLNSGKVVPIANSTGGEFTYFGSPQFSPDGSKIVYDATPGKNFSRSHIKLLSLEKGELTTRDLGPGNCPAFSPDGRSIAFLLNPGTGLEGTPGLWIMNIDGTRRQRLAGGSIPEWSPNGDDILNASFGSPVQVEMLDANDGDQHPIHFPHQRFYSIPNWVDKDTVVSLIVSPAEEQIALIDVSNPAETKVEKTLLKTTGTNWRKKIAHPVYSIATGACVFVYRDDDGMSLYRFKEGEEPKPIEPGQSDNRVAGLFMGPEGKFLLFCSDRDNSSITKTPPWPRDYENLEWEEESDSHSFAPFGFTR